MSRPRKKYRRFPLDEATGLPTWRPMATTPYGLELELCASYRGEENHFVEREREKAKFKLQLGSNEKRNRDIEEESGRDYDPRLGMLVSMLFIYYVEAPWKRGSGGGGSGKDPEPEPSPTPSLAA